jgi:hypothetical protein
MADENKRLVEEFANPHSRLLIDRERAILYGSLDVLLYGLVDPAPLVLHLRLFSVRISLRDHGETTSCTIDLFALGATAGFPALGQQLEMTVLTLPIRPGIPVEKVT